jgi:ectoine hydroxylase-related dioxygenase (phytanoyl-CoA dioxygenase family)
VLDLVESLIGPDIVLFSSHFICKPPAVGKRVPWHEDSAYWRGRIDPMEVVTVWLAIEPSTPANGCMQVVPRSHANGFSEYQDVANPSQQVFGTEIKPGQFDESKAVDCVLRPNECSMHDGRMIHGSAANTGTQRRCGYTMRYMPATVRPCTVTRSTPCGEPCLAGGRSDADLRRADGARGPPRGSPARGRHPARR